MMRYLARRVLHSVLLVFVISIASFLLLEIAPGTFVEEIRLNPQLSNETVSLLKSRFGLDQPLPVRYLRWLQSVAHGEFGFSFSYGLPAGQVIWPRARNTLLLTTASTALAWCVAVALGLITGMFPSSWVNRMVSAPLALLQAVPEVLLALVLVMAGVRMGWGATDGMKPQLAATTLASGMRDTAGHLLLPATALTLILLPLLTRHVQTAVREALSAPHIQAARALGITPWRFWTLYVLHSAANPLISLFGLSVGNLLSASILVEVVTAWPGLGPMLLEAIFSRDVHIVLGATLIAALFLIAGNLIADLLLWLADPRIRLGT